MNNYINLLKGFKAHFFDIIGISNLVIFGLSKEQFAFVIGTIGIIVGIVNNLISIYKKVRPHHKKEDSE